MEYTAGVETLSNKGIIIDNRNPPEIYSLSFSNEEDNQQQWIIYAKENGVCIELDFATLKDQDSGLILSMNDTKGYKITQTAYDCFQPACYVNSMFDISLSKEKIKEAFDEHKDPSGNEIYDFNAFLQLLASYYKVPFFRGETEIRASFLRVQNNDECTEIKYFELPNGILRPYIEISLYHVYHKGNNELEIPIRSILIGPGGRRDTVYNSVFHKIKYGKTDKLWKYSPKKKYELLSEYINCGITLQKINHDKDKLIFAYIVANSWSFEAEEYASKQESYVPDYKYIYTNYQINLIETGLSNKPGCKEITISASNTKPNPPADNDLLKIKKYVDTFEKTNYFSVHGIWIKQSTSPYIY
jgi:hypothetical protein